MKKAKFSLMGNTLDLDQIEGKMSAFAKMPYAITVKMSRPLAKDGYGKVTVDGKEISRGVPFLMESVVTLNCMLVPAGEVANEYGREYTLALSGFTADDGTPFQDKSFKIRTLPRREKDPAYKEHDRVALDAAREGMVLLQNRDHVLPLEETYVLNCFGAAQYMFRNTATGAGLINPRWQLNFHQAVEEHSRFTVNREISDLYCGLQDVVPPDELLQRAAEKSDTALIFISRTSGEFLDNKPIPGGYYLTEDEKKMIAAVSAVFKKKIVILNTGYPIEMGWIREYDIDAVLYTGFAGMFAGAAAVEILDGRTNPSGKLPDTWTFDYYDNPSSKNFINFSEKDTVPGEKGKGVLLYYEEDIYVGYRYFDTFGKPTAYPFGHGLSYTDFTISASLKGNPKEGLSVSVNVKNTGRCAGKEVVQVYVHAPEGRLEKPRRVLAAFEKTKLLKPRESQEILLPLEKMDYASFDEERGAYLLEAGEYLVYCGNSLDNAALCGRFRLEDEVILRKVNRVNPPVEKFHRMTKKEPYVEEDSKMTDLDQRIPVPAKKETYLPKPLKPYHGKRITYDELKKNPALLNDFVAQMSEKELCELNVCGGANWYMPWQDGSAGKVRRIRKYRIPKVEVSDGNTGLNIKKPNIGFPSSCTIAATFNKELAYNVGKVIGQESKENGIAINLGPAMNIHRNILNGRHPEYFSEDPYLAGTLAGMHAKGLEEGGTGSTYKHLFCNNSDTSRKGSHSIVSERAMREIYYRVFEIAFSIQKPSCVMTGYNCVNGIYPAENPQILKTLIRGEWGFDGMIMTDWGTYDTVDPVEMVKAGNCWLTEGNGKYVKILRQAVGDGRLSRNVLEQNVRYLIKTILHWA